MKKMRIHWNPLILVRYTFHLTALAALIIFSGAFVVVFRTLPRSLANTETISALQSAQAVRTLDEKRFNAVSAFLQQKRAGTALDWNALRNPLTPPAGP